MCSSKIICTFMHLFTLSVATDYCGLCEEPGTHTLCLYPTPALGPDCVSHSKAPISRPERESILIMHNIFRNRVATGGTKLPTAADMRKVYWDAELAIIAQRWMNQCKFEHDKCRDSGRFAVGQNIGKNSTSGNPSQPDYFGAIIRQWFEEIKHYGLSQVQLFEGDPNTENFTQMIWSRTYLIGCGRVTFREGDMKGDMMACNYGPTGNVLGGPVYEMGPPCTACPPGTYCSLEYMGLCSCSSRELYFIHIGIILQAFVVVTQRIMM